MTWRPRFVELTVSEPFSCDSSPVRDAPDVHRPSPSAPGPSVASAAGVWAWGGSPALCAVWRWFAALRFLVWTAVYTVAAWAATLLKINTLRDPDLLALWALVQNLAAPPPRVTLALAATATALFLLDVVWLIPAACRRYAVRLHADVCEIRLGLVFQTTRYVPPFSIQQVELFSSPVERAYGLARLMLYTPGYYDAVTVLWGVPQTEAEAIRRHLLSLAHHGHGVVPSASADPAG